MKEETILPLLRAAYACFQCGDMASYYEQLKQAKAAIDPDTDCRSLYGEWLLVFALSSLPDLDKLLPIYREARNHIDGFSRVLPRRAEFFLEYYNPLAICNPKPGHMDENAGKLTEAVKLFYSFTGGGIGTDICYRAQLAYFRGELGSAQKLAREAFEIASTYGQELTALCAAETLARIAIHSPDTSLWQFAYSHIRRAVTESTSRACREYAQIYYAELNLALGLLQTVPDWIKDGDFGAVSAPWGYQIIGDKLRHSVLPSALIVQTEYFNYSKNPVAALNSADMAQKIYGIDNALSNAHYDFFRAGCYKQLKDMDNVKASLSRAVDWIAPDGLWLIAAVFAPAFGDLLNEVIRPYDTGAEHIRETGTGFWDKLAPIRRKMTEGSPKSLTKRQEEVLSLLSCGKSNTWIARQLSISEATLKTHIRHIYGNLNVSSRDDLLEAMKDYQSTELAFWVPNEK